MSGRRPSFFDKLRALTPTQVLALGEAMILITLAAPVIRLTPFRQVGKLASFPVRRRVEDKQRRSDLIRNVSWAVDAASKHAKLRALCFECGLTAQIMLRRRGVDSTLHFGAAPGHDKGLSAHVWVLADGYDVTGAAIAHTYAPLAVFPPETDEKTATSS